MLILPLIFTRYGVINEGEVRIKIGLGGIRTQARRIVCLTTILPLLITLRPKKGALILVLVQKIAYLYLFLHLSLHEDIYTINAVMKNKI